MALARFGRPTRSPCGLADRVAQAEGDQGGRQHEPEVRGMTLPEDVGARGAAQHGDERQRNKYGGDLEPTSRLRSSDGGCQGVPVTSGF